MNEKRLQEYLELINKLLRCSNGEESKILTENQNLLDEGFLQTVKAVEENASHQGNENVANWLRNLRNQLIQMLNASSTVTVKQSLESLSEEEIQAYLQFLRQSLRVSIKSAGDAKAVYPLLAANIDKLDANLAEVLRRWATNIFIEAERKEAESIAFTIYNFSTLLQQFPLGNKAINIEIAITGYEVILTIFTQDASPYRWAAIQNSLGNAYFQRIKGNTADNIEQSIISHQNALKVCTPDKYPQDWAITKTNLGNAYWRRIKGNTADNIEQSIISYQNALKVYTPDKYPQDWAMTQDNLGISYRYRIKGDKADNIEQGIFYHQNALTVTTRNEFPQRWAIMRNNLGNAYWQRIKGDISDNIEQAIINYQDTLNVYTPNHYPQQWAMMQDNLGNAYRGRIKGNKADNIEQAILYHQNALNVHTRNDFPEKWAITQNNLGAAYLDRIEGTKADNIEQSIISYQNALNVYTRNNFPQQWAMIQNNLGTAYLDRIKGNKANNIEQAILSHQNALNIYTRNNYPQDNAESLFYLGIAYQDAKRFNEAYTTFEQAIEVVEYLRGEIISGDESKRKQAETWNKLYSSIVKVSLELKEETKAIEYIERSKTRNLSELLAIKDLYPTGDIPENARNELRQLRQDINIENRRLAAEEKPDSTYINKLRKRFNELFPYKSIQFEEIQKLLSEDTAIIQFYVFNDCIKIFIITCNNNKPIIWHSQADEKEKLVHWINEYFKHYYENKKNWEYQLTNQLTKLSSILNIDEIINFIPSHCKKVILVPHLFLHLLPLHALPLSSGEYLIDKFPDGVSYTPSCQILQQMQKRERLDFQSLFAIQNPTEDLNYTNLEVQVIKSYFNSNTSKVLEKTAATLTAINNSELNTYHCAHFSCHGYFNLTNPGKSALILANSPTTETPTNPDSELYLNVRTGKIHDLEKSLTLDKIFSLKLENCRLVTLSACETGLIDFKNTSDEYIGLPSGFLLAGSKAVVSSLWKVDDLSTALLIIRFYQNFKTGLTVAVALNQAQIWLRDSTNAELQVWTSQLKLTSEQAKNINNFLNSFYPDEQPFQEPVYWAAFCAVGQ